MAIFTMKKILASTLFISALGVGSIFSINLHAAPPAKSAPPAVPIVSEIVQAKAVNQSLSLVGKLTAKKSVDIASEVTGKIDVIAVQANQTVKSGQSLIVLDDAKAKAAVLEASAYLKDEQRKLAELTRLVARHAITQTELDAQKASVDIARARLDAANANLRDQHISAPFDGTIGFIDFSRGKMVSSGTQLLTLDDLSIMQLDLQVPEHYLSMINIGMNVTAKTSAWGETEFNGTIVGVDTRINEETLSLRVRIDFDNAANQLKPGMLVSANIEFPAINAPIIPVQALEYSGTHRYVYVVNENNKVTRTQVFLGTRVENQVVINKGLNIGDKIVVQGIVNMRDGILIRDMSAQPTENVTNEQQKDSN